MNSANDKKTGPANISGQHFVPGPRNSLAITRVFMAVLQHGICDQEQRHEFVEALVREKEQASADAYHAYLFWRDQEPRRRDGTEEISVAS